jgi:carbon storage regulator
MEHDTMLVMSRRVGERIVIDGCVWITVTRLTPSKVEIGIEAPKEVLVDREEIYVRKQQGQGGNADETQGDMARGRVGDAPSSPAEAIAERRVVGDARPEQQRATPRIEGRRRRS